MNQTPRAEQRRSADPPHQPIAVFVDHTSPPTVDRQPHRPRFLVHRFWQHIKIM